VSNAIQELLREPRPSLFLDMGQGSREQSLPVGDDPSAARCDAPASVALAADSLPAGNVVVGENMRRGQGGSHRR